MKQNWTMYVYKRDRRTKSGERLFSTQVFTDSTLAEMQAVVQVGTRMDPLCRFEFVPTTKIVKNLMTGEQVEIAHDTPRSCDPSSELYWSM
jgi:hypothetical protein